MELKVWVDGIEKVVCGLTDSSTCQDVVFVLASAIGRTGKFTLVEKWRDNERLIPPHENPLQCLHNWGEYAQDVRFILRWSDGCNDKSNLNSSPYLKTVLETDFSRFNSSQSPHSHTKTPSSIKKSLTFNGSRRPPGSDTRQKPKPGCSRLIEYNTPPDSYDGDHSAPSTNSSPYSSLRSTNGHNGYSGNHRGHGPPNYYHHSRSSSSASAGTGSSVHSPHSSITQRHQNHVTPPRTIGSPHKGTIDSVSTGPLPGNNSKNNSNKIIHNRNGSNLSTHSDSSGQGRGHQWHRTPQTRSTVSNGVTSHTTNNRRVNGINSEINNEHRELMQLVNMQKEKIDEQNSSIDKLLNAIQQGEAGFGSSEIIASNDSLLEAEADHSIDVQIKEMKSEIERLSELSVKNEDELQQLELVSWQEKLRIESEQEKMLHSELKLLEERIKTTESELEQQKLRTVKISTEIETVQNQAEEEQKQIDEQKKSLTEDKNKEILIKKDICKVEGELNETDEQLMSKELQLNELEKQLRQDNLQVFCTTNISQSSNEDSSQRQSLSRPGSARKLACSPQMMKHTQNRDGYWV